MDLDAMIEKEAARQAASEGNGSTVTDLPTDGEKTSTEVKTELNDKTVETTENTPAASDKPDTTDQNKNAKPADTTDTDAAFIQRLERLSGGQIKTTEDLNAAVAKLKDYDIISEKARVFEEKANSIKFADAYEQRRNELKLSGASKDQLKSFQQINELGELSEMDDLEAKVQKLILVDGFGEKAARLKVSREFNFEDTFDDDLELMKEDLRLSAKADRKALETFKAEVSTPAPDKKILDAAGKQALETSLKPILADFSEKINSLTTFNLKGVNSDEVVPLELALTADDKTVMTNSIKDYMLGNNLPLTQENLDEAIIAARREYLEVNQPKIAEKIWAKAEAHFTKKFADKYENVGGLPKGDSKPSKAASEEAAAIRSFKDDMLGRTRHLSN